MTDQQISDRGLQQVSVLIDRQLNLAQRIANAEEALAALADEYRRCAEVDLPLAMQEAGLKSFVTTDGRKVTIKDEVYASISKSKEREAFEWLTAHGFGDIIKHQVTIEVGRGEDKLVTDVLMAVGELGLEGSNKRTVHVGTLKAFLKEQLAAGTNVPLDLFGAHCAAVAHIK